MPHRDDAERASSITPNRRPNPVNLTTPRTPRATFSFARLGPELSAFVSANKRLNARHHPPARKIELESRAVAGRVHAVVRLRRGNWHYSHGAALTCSTHCTTNLYLYAFMCPCPVKTLRPSGPIGIPRRGPSNRPTTTISALAGPGISYTPFFLLRGGLKIASKALRTFLSVHELSDRSNSTHVDLYSSQEGST